MLNNTFFIIIVVIISKNKLVSYNNFIKNDKNFM